MHQIGDILRGLLYLHTEGIIHGDLRGVGYLLEPSSQVLISDGQSNVLLEDDLTAVIADFGLSHFANGHSKNYASRRSGNVEWLSPELLSENGPNGDPRPTKESDIYSFAMVCIEVGKTTQRLFQFNKRILYRHTLANHRLRMSRRRILPSGTELSKELAPCVRWNRLVVGRCIQSA